MSKDDGPVENVIDGGLFLHTVIQGRNITVRLPPQITPSLSGLPAPSTTFAGRDEHLSALLRCLAPSQGQEASRVTAVAGLAGIGKTELAVHAAKEALNRTGWFPGGVLFIDLFGYDSARCLPAGRALEGLLRSLAVPGDHIPEGLEDRQRLYRSVLAQYAQQGQRILVIIDNASSAEQARPLLPTDGETAALVTSRHTLDSLDARLLDLGPLDQAASVLLLDQALCHARGSHDTRIASDATAASEIARLCAGLPLALRIAVALLAAFPSRPAGSLAEALQVEHSRLDRLRRPDRAVRAAFDLSYALLDAEHARLFRLLSLQPGPDLSTEAASRLAAIEVDCAGDMLQHLADAHLVDAGQTWGRWRMHDLVRIYAQEKIEDQPEKYDALTRLFDFYLQFSRDGATALISGSLGGVFSSQGSALSWLDAEKHNLVASVFAATEDYPSYAAELPHRLAKYLDMRRFFTDWEAVMQVSHAILDGSGHAEFEAGALDSLGMAARMQHKFSEAVKYHRQAIALAREADRDDLLCRYLNNLGISLLEIRSFNESLAAHNEAAGISLRLNDDIGFARAADNAASALRELGDLDAALEFHEKAIEKFSKRGVAEGVARSLTHMGSTLHDMGRYPEAAAKHRESSKALKRLGLLNEAGHALANLSNSLRRAGELEEALTVIQESLEIFQATKDTIGHARALNQAGLVRIARHEYELAKDSLEEALSTLRDREELIDCAYTHANLGIVFSVTENPGLAVAALRTAHRLFLALNAPKDALRAKSLMDSMYTLMASMNERSPLGGSKPIDNA
ncbi:ATP-binding protein [Streptomyces sp. NPDC056704]|uniref:ATP-binding protein n=1 Tax=Streptomyces sp. NPDC056704 TaxID=3345917 RepID=UPI0036AF69F3